MSRNLDVTLPGTLMRVGDVGVLLRGAARSGKSETALALIDRGHHLIADDAVRIRAGNHDRLEGMAPDLLRGQLCVRGLGTIDVSHQFPGRVSATCAIDLIVELVAAGPERDPLHGTWSTCDLLGETLPLLRPPPGRPLGLLVGQAAAPHRRRRRGHDPAAALAAAQGEALQ